MTAKTVKMKHGMVMVEYRLVVKLDEVDDVVNEFDNLTGERGLGIYNFGSSARQLTKSEEKEVFKMVPEDILEKKGIKNAT